MNLVLDRTEEVADFVETHSPHFEVKPDSVAIGLEDSAGIAAGVVYDDYTGRSICMHVAALPGKRWMRPENLRAFFAYPFSQLGVARVTAMVPSVCQPWANTLQRLGFKYEGILRDAAEDGDILIFGMLRRECRYIEEM